MAFPLVSERFSGRLARVIGRTFLVVVRGTPDYMFAYLLLQLLGLSMLPAVLALGIHNGGIIAFLMGRHADTLDYRRDAPKGLDLYAYETMPRLFGQFVALVLYRYEIIVRESAILGTLSIYTLGFYVAGAIDDFKMDTAVVLLVATGLLSLTIDATLARRPQPPAHRPSCDLAVERRAALCTGGLAGEPRRTIDCALNAAPLTFARSVPPWGL